MQGRDHIVEMYERYSKAQGHFGIDTRNYLPSSVLMKHPYDIKAQGSPRFEKTYRSKSKPFESRNLKWVYICI